MLTQVGLNILFKNTYIKIHRPKNLSFPNRSTIYEVITYPSCSGGIVLCLSLTDADLVRRQRPTQGRLYFLAGEDFSAGHGFWLPLGQFPLHQSL